MKKIVSLKGLADITKTHRSRLYDWMGEKRLRPDYEDDQGRPFWKDTTAQALADTLKEQRETRRPGPGGRIVLDIPRKPKDEAGEA